MPVKAALKPGNWMIAGLWSDVAVVQLALSQIGDVVSGAMTTTRLDGDGENWSISGRNDFPDVTLELSTFGRPELRFVGTFDGHVLEGTLEGDPGGAVPVRIFRARHVVERTLNGAWTLPELPSRFTPIQFMMEELNGYVLGSLSVLDGGLAMDFTISGNDFRPELPDVHLLFHAQSPEASFTFTGKDTGAGPIEGTLGGALTGPAKLVRGGPSIFGA